MNERPKALTDAECRAATLADICCTQAGRIAELEAALDDLLMHCVDGPSADWIMLPRTEFDQVKGRLTPKPKQE
jgi:hypothetical protein